MFLHLVRFGRMLQYFCEEFPINWIVGRSPSLRHQLNVDPTPRDSRYGLRSFCFKFLHSPLPVRSESSISKCQNTSTLLSKCRHRLAPGSRVIRKLSVVPEKSGFYEQVIYVNLAFSSLLLFCCSWSAYCSPPCFYSHFGEPLRLCVGWGQKEKSMLPVIGRPRLGPNPTRSQRDAG